VSQKYIPQSKEFTDVKNIVISSCATIPAAPYAAAMLACTSSRLWDRAIAQAVSRRLLVAEDCVRPQGGPCWICGGQSDTRTGSSPSSSVFPC
jgi:hypothetical protein